MQSDYVTLPATDPRYPAARFLAGHMLFADKKMREGLDVYADALKSAPALKESDMLARNLVNALGYQSTPAAQLISQYTTPRIIDYLALRSGKPGSVGRGYAVRLRRIP